MQGMVCQPRVLLGCLVSGLNPPSLQRPAKRVMPPLQCWFGACVSEVETAIDHAQTGSWRVLPFSKALETTLGSIKARFAMKLAMLILHDGHAVFLGDDVGSHPDSGEGRLWRGVFSSRSFD